MRRETQIIKDDANNTIVFPLSHAASLVVLKISAGRDPNWIAFQIRKTQSRASAEEIQQIYLL